jgi:serine/threonine protein kinase
VTVAPPQIPGYRFVEGIGSGGYADVYRYRQLSPDRDVAVKVLKDGFDEEVREKFTDEANAIAELGDHPHIVTVFSAAVTPDDRPYIVMSYCPGKNFADRAHQERFAVRDVLTVGIKIAKAVAAAHRAEILHRDIKPANILTDQWGEPRLADFGIAGRMANAQTTNDVALSVPWAPPEVVRGGTAGVPSDLYSLGATLWHLLAGHSPFWVMNRDDTVEAMMSRILTTPMPPLRRPDVPAEVEILLRRVMAPHPPDRPRSANKLREQLEELQRRVENGAYVPHFPPPPREPDVVPSRTQPRQKLPAPPDQSGQTVARPVPVDATPVDRTQIRPVEAEPSPAPPRKRWPTVSLVVGVLAGVVSIGVLLVGGDPPVDTGRSGAQVTDPGDAMQDAGLPGADAPPGEPTVTAARVADGSVRFSWTYSAQLATDTFAWQTPDGAQKGVAKGPELVLPATSGAALCLQIKVVRADGSYAAADWSEPDCAD